MKLKFLDKKYVVVKLPKNFTLNKEILNLSFYNIVKTPDELSLIVRNDEFNYTDYPHEDNWCILIFDAILDFELTGVLDKIISPLSENGISVFVFSSFDTDYVMFKSENKNKVISILKSLRYEFVN